MNTANGLRQSWRSCASLCGLVTLCWTLVRALGPMCLLWLRRLDPAAKLWLSNHNLPFSRCCWQMSMRLALPDTFICSPGQLQIARERHGWIFLITEAVTILALPAFRQIQAGIRLR